MRWQDVAAESPVVKLLSSRFGSRGPSCTRAHRQDDGHQVLPGARKSVHGRAGSRAGRQGEIRRAGEIARRALGQRQNAETRAEGVLHLFAQSVQALPMNLRWSPRDDAHLIQDLGSHPFCL